MGTRAIGKTISTNIAYEKTGFFYPVGLYIWHKE